MYTERTAVQPDQCSPVDTLTLCGSVCVQVEGAWDKDGRTPSVWDVYSHIPGNIKNNDNGGLQAAGAWANCAKLRSTHPTLSVAAVAAPTAACRADTLPHCLLLLLLLLGLSGDIACDMYHKYPEDFAMMQQMGIKHYRCGRSRCNQTCASACLTARLPLLKEYAAELHAAQKWLAQQFRQRQALP